MTATSAVVERSQLADAGRKNSVEWQRLLLFTLVFVGACVILFADLGKYPLFNPDESLYAEPAREMLETGEYITTLLNYVVRFTKPPLVIWAMAGSYQIFGVNEFAARFFGAVCGALMIAFAYLVVEKYASQRAALISAAMLITCPLFIAVGRLAITDMPLTLFTTGALYSFFHGFTQRASGWRWVGYTLVGLAVMTKGPVGLVVPGAIVFAYHILRGNLVDAWKYYRPISGALLVALIAVPWFAVEIYVTKGAYFQEFLVRENFQRFTAVVDHKYPWWYHLAAIAGGCAPWTIFFPMALVSAVRSLNLSKPVLGVYGLYRQLSPERSFVLFNLLTAGIIVTFYSISVSKLLPYTVPAFPALAALLGIYLNSVISEQRSKALAIPLMLLSIGLGIGLAIVPVAVGRLRDAPPELVSLAYSGVIVLLIVAAASCVSALRKRVAAAVTFFAIALYAVFLGFGSKALDVLAAEWETPLPPLAHFAGQSDWPIFIFHMRKPGVPFYAKRQVKLPYDEAELITGLGQTNGAYILARTKDLTFLQSLPNCRVVAIKGRFALVAQLPRSQ